MPTPFSRPALLLAALLLTAACKKDKVAPVDQLPAATTTGADTWGCLVNGEVWKASGLRHVRADWTTPAGVSATMGFTTYSGNTLEAHNVNFSFADTTGRYELKAGSFSLVPMVRSLAYGSLETPSKRYNPLNVTRGSVTLTRLDRQAGIMSGTFDFVITGLPGDTVRVTNGRFDISHMDR